MATEPDVNGILRLEPIAGLLFAFAVVEGDLVMQGFAVEVRR